MIVWILRHVAPKYFVVGLLCLVFGSLATWSGTRAIPAKTDLQTIPGVVDEVFARCSRGNSCTHFIALKASDATYKVSLSNCRGAENELHPGDTVRIGFSQGGWSSHGGSAYFIDHFYYAICTYDQASAVQEQLETGNFRLGVLALIAAVVALVGAFVVGAARGYN